MGNWAKALFRSEDSERGAALAEWGLLVVLVAVRGTPEYGGQAAAPAVRKIMKFSLQHLEIAP